METRQFIILGCREYWLMVMLYHGFLLMAAFVVYLVSIGWYSMSPLVNVFPFLIKHYKQNLDMPIMALKLLGWLLVNSSISFDSPNQYLFMTQWPTTFLGFCKLIMRLMNIKIIIKINMNWMMVVYWENQCKIHNFQ